MPDDGKKKVVLKGGKKDVGPNEITQMDPAEGEQNGDVVDPLEIRTTDTGKMEKMEPAAQGDGGQKSRKMIKLKPMPKGGASESAGEDIHMEETVSMDRDKVIAQEKGKGPATIIKKEGAGPANAQTAQYKVSGQDADAVAPAKPTPMKLTPKAPTPGTGEEDDETVKIERPQVPKKAAIKLTPVSGKPAPPSAAEKAPPEGEEEDTVKLEKAEKPPVKPQPVKAKVKLGAAGAQTTEHPIPVAAQEAKPAKASIKLTPMKAPAAGEKEDDATVKIQRPDKPEAGPSVQPVAPAAQAPAPAPTPAPQQKPSIPGAKRTIKLRPSTTGGATAPAPSAPTQGGQSAAPPPSKATIKLKPIGAAGSEAAAATPAVAPAPGASSAPSSAPSPAGAPTTAGGAKTRNTIKLMPKTGGGAAAPQKASVSVQPSAQTVDAAAVGSAPEVTPSSPTVKTPSPAAAGERPKAPTIKLKPKSDQATAGGGLSVEPKPSDPTVKFQTGDQEAPPQEEAKRPSLTIKKSAPPTSAPIQSMEEPEHLREAAAQQKGGVQKAKSEPSWLYAIASCLVIGALGFFIFVMIKQFDLLSKLG